MVKALIPGLVLILVQPVYAQDSTHVSTKRPCRECHHDVHDGALGKDCAQCHVTQAWLGAEMMRQHEQGRFLLTGAHRAVPCKSCHVDGNFKLVFDGCRQCHGELVQNTSSPNHSRETNNRDCMQCHSTRSWTPASFDHGATRFLLTGAHTTMACHSCHADGNYELKYVDCYQCHEAQFKQPASPNHVAANFPHDCSPCHSTTTWRPSIFTHDQQKFRIFLGKHRNVWSACSDCHQNASNFTFFSCFSCHGENEMSQYHTSVSGYSYASPACYSCHRDV